MTSLISLTAVDLFLAALLVVALSGLSAKLQLGLSMQLIIAALRTTAQLLIVGLILKTVFTEAHLSWVILITIVMLCVASWEILARQKESYEESGRSVLVHYRYLSLHF